MDINWHAVVFVVAVASRWLRNKIVQIGKGLVYYAKYVVECLKKE